MTAAVRYERADMVRGGESGYYTRVSQEGRQPLPPPGQGPQQKQEEAAVEAGDGGLWRFAAGTLSASLGVMALTAPLSAVYFGSLSLVSPLASRATRYFLRRSLDRVQMPSRV